MSQTETLPHGKDDPKTEERMVQVSRLKPAPWNPKVIAPERRATLKAELISQGPTGTAPLEVVPEGLLEHPPVMNLPKDPNYVVADGNMRLDIITKDLKWAEARVIIHYDLTKTDAMLLTYAREYGRGELDPFKEGDFFRILKEDAGLTLEALSKRLSAMGINFDVTTLSRKIAVSKIPTAVKDKVAESSHMTPSALEEIATLSTPEQQMQVVKEVDKEAKDLEEKGAITKGEKVSVRRVAQKVKEVKQEEAARKSFDELLAKAKFKVCPTCKRPPQFDSTHDYGKDPKPLFRCDSVSGWWEHKWDPMTGEQPNAPKHIPTPPGEAADKVEKSKPVEFPDFIRTTHTVEEVRQAGAMLIREFVLSLDSVDEVRLTGKTSDGREAQFFLSKEWVSGDTTLETKGIGHATLFRVEPKKYKEDSLKDYHAIVRSGGTIKNSQQAAKVEQDFEAFLKKYLPTPTKKSQPPKATETKAAKAEAANQKAKDAVAKRKKK